MEKSQGTYRTDAELLAAMQASAYEELLFFSNRKKEDRERWVVSEFLRRRSVNFLDTELKSPDQHSKTDVHFRGANFQVKESLNPGTNRGNEVKATYQRLMAAATLEQVVGPQFSYDVPSPTTVYELVFGAASRLVNEPKYVDVKRDLDLLFYVTRTRASLIRADEIDAKGLSSLGWRSISSLAGSQAMVLFSQMHAPSFLRS